MIVQDVSAESYRKLGRYAYEEFLRIIETLKDRDLHPSTAAAQCMEIAIEAKYRLAAELEKVAT